MVAACPCNVGHILYSQEVSMEGIGFLNMESGEMESERRSWMEIVRKSEGGS